MERQFTRCRNAGNKKQRGTSSPLLVLAAVLPLIAPPLAGAPIELRCSIQDTYLTADYKQSTALVERQLCAQLKGLLAGHPEFLAWEYTAGGTTEVALELRLFNDRGARELELRLRRDVPVRPWTAVWKKPGDPKPDPTAGRAAAFFTQRVDALILSEFGEAIQKNLKGIPVASARWSSEGAPHVVSSLSWKGHRALRASLFRVSCTGTDPAAGMELRSEVQEAKISYEGPLALRATHRLSDNRRIEEILAEVKRLQPRKVFLLELILPDVPDTF